MNVRDNIGEVAAVVLVLLIVVALPILMIGYEKATAADYVTVEASRQEDGGFSPGVIRVKQGQTVRLRILGRDVIHGLAIPGLGVEVEKIVPGKEAIVEFKAEEKGTYPFVCTVFCSPKHGEMRGQVVVE